MAKPKPAEDPNVATPENTPIPGGGRWRWDIPLPGWIEIDDAGKPVPVITPPAATPASTSE